LGIGKWSEKNSGMVGNFPPWRKTPLPLHGAFSPAAPVVKAGIYLPLEDDAVTLKGSHRMGGRQNWLKISGPLPFINTVSMKIFHFHSDPSRWTGPLNCVFATVLKLFN
jgi:hypothetical protein